MIEQIKFSILQTLPNATVYVADPNKDGEHFEAIVIDETFNSISLVKQHQLVMNALKEKFATTVHALALKTFTPKKWEEQKHNYKGV
jgi:acid stress-induced BolA-like protein IbaG/YrbA